MLESHLQGALGSSHRYGVWNLDIRKVYQDHYIDGKVERNNALEKVYGTEERHLHHHLHQYAWEQMGSHRLRLPKPWVSHRSMARPVQSPAINCHSSMTAWMGTIKAQYSI